MSRIDNLFQAAQKALSFKHDGPIILTRERAQTVMALVEAHRATLRRLAAEIGHPNEMGEVSRWWDGRPREYCQCKHMAEHERELRNSGVRLNEAVKAERAAIAKVEAL